MKRFSPALILFLLASYSEAVSNRVVEDVKALREAGFRFEYSPDYRSSKIFTLTIRAPKEFKFDSGGDTFVKPFVGISIVQTVDRINDPTGLLGAPSSWFHLETHEDKDGRNSCRFDVLATNAPTSYIVATFAYEPTDGRNDWPMLVYIPISKLIEQFQAESGRGDRIAPVTPPTPPGMRGRTGRFQSDH
jgi:hypothetical protein